MGMKFTTGVLFLCIVIAATASGFYLDLEYVVDSDWKPSFPVGSGIFSAVAVTGNMVVVDQRDADYSDPIIFLDRNGSMIRSFGGADIAQVSDPLRCNSRPRCFGSHGVAVQRADLSKGRPEDTIWVMDFFNHTVLSYSTVGELLGKAGRSGIASADFDKFGSVADVAFREDDAFFADGDGGSNNRVERWAAASGKPDHVRWVSPADPPKQRKKEEYQNPHGICWHETSDRLLVADREHSRIAVVNPNTGVDEGNLRCDALQLGKMGKPFGVRTLKTPFLDLLFVAVSNNPQDGENQFVHVVDVSADADGLSCKSVIQSIAFAAPGKSAKPGEVVCHTPHLMGVDHETGDLYLACVAVPGSNLIRIKQREPSTDKIMV